MEFLTSNDFMVLESVQSGIQNTDYSSFDYDSSAYGCACTASCSGDCEGGCMTGCKNGCSGCDSSCEGCAR